MNVENLAALVNAKSIQGPSRWEIASFAAEQANCYEGCAVFIKDKKQAINAAQNGALAIVCEESAAMLGEDISQIIVDDINTALARLIRLMCANKYFYIASNLESQIAKLQGYCVLKGDVFADFDSLYNANNKLFFCADSEYLYKISAPFALPEADFKVFRAASLFYEDVQFGEQLFNSLTFCHLFNEPFSKVFQAAINSGMAKPIKPLFEVVFLHPDASKAKFGSTHCAVIFTQSQEIANTLQTANIACSNDYLSALKHSVSFHLGTEASFLPQISKLDYSLFD